MKDGFKRTGLGDMVHTVRAQRADGTITEHIVVSTVPLEIVDDAALLPYSARFEHKNIQGDRHDHRSA